MKRLTENQKKKIVEIANRYGIKNVSIFGSYATGLADESSDLDLLIELEDGRDLLDISGFRFDVIDLLNIKVDVISIGAINKYIKDDIIKVAVPI